jgi:hypothetical protein
MARPYPAGGVSIAESNKRCRRPAVSSRLRPPGIQRAYLPRVFPAPSLLFPTAPHTGLGPRSGGAGARIGPEGLAPAFAISALQFAAATSASRKRRELCRRIPQCIGGPGLDQQHMWM